VRGRPPPLGGVSFGRGAPPRGNRNRPQPHSVEDGYSLPPLLPFFSPPFPWVCTSSTSSTFPVCFSPILGQFYVSAKRSHSRVAFSPHCCASSSVTMTFLLRFSTAADRQVPVLSALAVQRIPASLEGRPAARSLSAFGVFKRSAPKTPLTALLANHILYYPTPANLTYFWGFGSLSAAMLGVQLITGIMLAMHYNSSTELAFASVEHIMRDVNYGWLLRGLHANGAAFFLVAVYVHILRALLYRATSFAHKGVWLSGVAILALTMGSAFIGYTLPWGQMSLWGMVVITNLISVVPFVGTDLVTWVWGGFSVGAPTLSRFFALHYLLPFILAAVAALHIFQLHNQGSSNPLSVEHREIAAQPMPLAPYFLVKDLLGLLVFGTAYAYFVFFDPNALGHSDNFIEANPLVTPAHIVPEFYFLPFYAILRSIPNKTLGVVAMAAAIALLALLPLESRVLQSGGLQPGALRWRERELSSGGLTFAHTWAVCVFAAVFLLLGVIGARPAEEPYVFCGQLLTVLYFGLLGNFFTPALVPLRENAPLLTARRLQLCRPSSLHCCLPHCFSRSACSFAETSSGSAVRLL